MSLLLSHAENSLPHHLSQDVAQTSIRVDLHQRAFEDYQLHAVVPLHQATDDPIETSIHTDPEPSRDLGRQDGTEHAQGQTLLDLALHLEDEEVDVIAQVVMEVEDGEAQVTAATVAMMTEAGAEVAGVEGGEDVSRRSTLKSSAGVWKDGQKTKC